MTPSPVRWDSELAEPLSAATLNRLAEGIEWAKANSKRKVAAVTFKLTDAEAMLAAARREAALIQERDALAAALELADQIMNFDPYQSTSAPTAHSELIHLQAEYGRLRAALSQDREGEGTR